MFETQAQVQVGDWVAVLLDGTEKEDLRWHQVTGFFPNGVRVAIEDDPVDGQVLWVDVVDHVDTASAFGLSLPSSH